MGGCRVCSMVWSAGVVAMGMTGDVVVAMLGDRLVPTHSVYAGGWRPPSGHRPWGGAVAGAWWVGGLSRQVVPTGCPGRQAGRPSDQLVARPGR